MDPRTRRAAIAGAVVLFGAGLLLGFLLGRTGDDDEGSLASPSPSPEVSTTVAPPVVVSAGELSEYSAQYPNGEPPCCPPSYLRRTIAFEDGFFRFTASETVLPTAVPASQI